MKKTNDITQEKLADAFKAESRICLDTLATDSATRTMPKMCCKIHS